MWNCTNCHESVENDFDVCWNCGTTQDGQRDPTFESQREVAPQYDLPPVTSIPPSMILTSTPTIESHTVRRYWGLVFGETIVGANILSDFFASVTDIVGGRSNAYESALANARRIAITEMSQQAAALGGNAVLSIKVDYELIRGSMLMVTCSGTAVTVDGPQAGGMGVRSA